MSVTNVSKENIPENILLVSNFQRSWEKNCELRKGRLSKVGQDCDTAVMHGPAMIDLC